MARKRRLTQKDFGKIGAFKRYPNRLINPETGEWKPQAIKALVAMANQLLGVSKGRKIEGLREKRPEQESTWSTDWIDSRASETHSTHKPHRRKPAYTKPICPYDA